MDVGVVVHNVGTAMAVAEAILEGKPLVRRIVTVTGEGIQEPKNVVARLGTTFHSILDYCGGLSEQASQVFMGGPMMGIAQSDLEVPVIKATSGIICETSQRVMQFDSSPCIRCGACIDACPMNLLPTRLARLSEMKKIDEAADLGIQNCIECGSCAFACPSHIPLVQWIRVGKPRDLGFHPADSVVLLRR
jgi:electron transport complex protein RnfC